jgi:nucleotidyltransferase substrate binding protein (TIGR01987 family)
MSKFVQIVELVRSVAKSLLQSGKFLISALISMGSRVWLTRDLLKAGTAGKLILMKLNITALKNACLSLDNGINRAKREPNDLEVRDACIQRFEYTYELCIKSIKRFIELEMPLFEKIDQMNYRDLLRVAFEIGLIINVEDWFAYREARNQTSHTYDQNKAKAVFEVAVSFVITAKRLINELERRLQ